MMKRGTIFTILAIVAFAALLLYNTLSAQKVECTVCVDYNGHHNCATASHSDEAEARRAAQSTACGPIAGGMTESIACGKIEPSEARCRTK